MTWTHMPDTMENYGLAPAANQFIGYRSSACNSIYYDPDRTYTIPVDSTGAKVVNYGTDFSFNNAYYDFYNDPAERRDLTKDFQAYDHNTIRHSGSAEDTKQFAYYYQWKDTTRGPDTDECHLSPGSSWERVVVGAAEQENFAIWYSFYRTRLALAKSAIGQAFLPVTDKYRVGFITVSPTLKAGGADDTDPADAGDAVMPERFSPLATFDGAHKAAWYAKLYGQQPGGSSPAREGLARVGRYYAGKHLDAAPGINAGMAAIAQGEDSMLRECQPNYTILTTDGYWNAQGEKTRNGTNTTVAAGPLKWDASGKVGSPDSDRTGKNGTTGENGYSPFGVYDGSPSDAGYQIRKYQMTGYELTACNLPILIRKYSYQYKYEYAWYKTEYDEIPATNSWVSQPLYANYDVVYTLDSWKFTKDVRIIKKVKTTVNIYKRIYLKDKGGAEESENVAICVSGGGFDQKDTETTDCRVGYPDGWTKDAREAGEGEVCTPGFDGVIVTWCHTGNTYVQDSSGSYVPCVAGNNLVSCEDNRYNQPATYSECYGKDDGSYHFSDHSDDVGTTYIRCHMEQYPQQTYTTWTICTNNGATGYNNGGNGVREYDGKSYKCSRSQVKVGNSTTTPCATPQGPQTGVVGIDYTYHICEGAGSTGSVCNGPAGSCDTKTDNYNYTNGFNTPLPECTSGRELISSGKYRVTECQYNNNYRTTRVLPETCEPTDSSAPNTANGGISVTCSGTYGPYRTNDANCVANTDNGIKTECEEGFAAYGKKLTKKDYENWYKVYDYDPGNERTYSTYVNSIVNDVELDADGNAVCHEEAAAPSLPPTVRHTPPTTTYYPGGGGTQSWHSLADVAQHYYWADLRPSWPDKVQPSGNEWYDDKNTAQHMVTYVVGLGVSGTVRYSDRYYEDLVLNPAVGPGANCTAIVTALGLAANDPLMDFCNIRAGAASWPRWLDISGSDTSGGYITPVRDYENDKSIDDFWHAAVNGRGRYFSAKNPSQVVSGIKSTLDAIGIRAGSGTSWPIANPLEPGVAFASSYKTKEWSGELRAVDMPHSIGEGQAACDPLNPTAACWSASVQIGGKLGADCDTRKIYYRDGAALADFTWDTQVCGGSASTGLNSALQAHFSNAVQTLSQYAAMTDGTAGSVNQKELATGQSLVNFLRGQRQHEGYESGTSKLYRTRVTALGDIVNSRPVYVGKGYLQYVDPGYGDFKTNTVDSRTPMVYVGANDGMLHAFDAETGEEKWAYIPHAAMTNLPLLANSDYQDRHEYFVDATPVVADIKRAGGEWRTILVGGLGKGGKGIYALDVTAPANPQSLWEFNAPDATTSALGTGLASDLGYSYGKPLVGKLKADLGSASAGTWAVFVASGYNNATGKGKLFVLNAETGATIATIDTGAGSAATPSGLAHLAAYAENQLLDNTVERLYGGDLLGNVWRFDLYDTAPSDGQQVYRIGKATDPDGNAQPITVAPYLATWNTRNHVMVGTGKLLDAADTNNSQDQVQSVYDLIDPLDGVDAGALRVSGLLRKMEVRNESGDPASQSLWVRCAETDRTVCDDSDKGWYVDLAYFHESRKASERVNVEMAMAGEVLVVSTNQPLPDVCSVEATGRIYFIHPVTGESLTEAYQYPEGYANVGVTVGLNENGEITVYGGSNKGTVTEISPDQPVPQAGGRHMSWRELTRPMFGN
jgi:Tfp pilus tip-associated adhesin PilY1